MILNFQLHPQEFSNLHANPSNYAKRFVYNLEEF